MLSLLNTTFTTAVRRGVTVIGTLLSKLKARATNFENKSGTEAILQELENDGLLSKASIVVTPTGYGSGTINAIKPSESPYDGDLDFTRASSATRVNASGFIESVASGIPRIDYLGGTGKILTEESCTNKIVYSSDFTQWANTESSDAANQTTSPDGTTNATRLTDTTATANHIITSQSFTLSSGAATMSIFAKADTLNYLRLRTNGTSTGVRIWFDLSNGTVTHEDVTGAGHIENYGNGWYRCSVTDASNTNTGSGSLQVFLQNASGFQTTYTGSGSGSVFIWGGQYEQCNFATSYLPTTSSAVTRAAETAINGGTSSLISSTEGVLYIEAAALIDGDTAFRRLSLSDGSASNRVLIGINNQDKFQAIISSSGSTVANMLFEPTDISTMSKVAVKYKNNDCALWVDGTERATDTSAAMPTGLDELAFDQGNGTQNFHAKTKCVAVFKEALTDTELQNLTS